MCNIAGTRRDLELLIDAHTPAKQGHGYNRCESCCHVRHPCEVWDIATEALEAIRQMDLLFQSLTPGGSEFVNDPQRCVKFALDLRESQHNLIKRNVMDKKDAIARAEKAEKELNQPRCPDCCGELSYCGPDSIDGPTLDCRVCQLKDRLDEANANNDAYRQNMIESQN